MDQIKSYELKRLHIAANKGEVVEDNSQDLLDEIRDLVLQLDGVTLKLKKEKMTSKKLRAELKEFKNKQ